MAEARSSNGQISPDFLSFRISCLSKKLLDEASSISDQDVGSCRSTIKGVSEFSADRDFEKKILIEDGSF